MSPKAPEEMTNRCSSRTVPMSKVRDVDVDEDRRGRGIKKKKYPLDDYLIIANTQTNTRPTLLSPLSSVSSPETLDVLANAERLVENAQKQMMEISLNSALNTLEENSGSFVGQRPLDDSLLYVREIVESKFQESNNPDRMCGRKISTSHLPDPKKKLQHDKFSVKESTGIIYKPFEISAQNSEFLTNHLPDKSFFKEESDRLKIEPLKHSNVFPTSTLNDTKFRNKNWSTTTRRCTMTNTGIIEIDSRDPPHGTIQIQTGPTLDIRGGLTVQTIENVHISPDPSSVPLYNNIATYCFRHEPSTGSNFTDSNQTRLEKHRDSVTGTRNFYDARKEKHIRSTNYNDTETVVPIENTSDAGIAVIKDSNNFTRDAEQDTDHSRAMPINRSNSNHLINNKLDSNRDKNGRTIDSNIPQSFDLRESSNDDEKLHERKISCGFENGGEEGARSMKSVGINSTPVKSFVREHFSVPDSEGKSRNEKIVSEGESPPQDFNEISTKLAFASSSGDEKCNHVQSEKDYVSRTQVCGRECKTGSCSKKFERDFKHEEKQKSKDALEAIANIEKIRYDIRDTGVVPAECTQICEDENQCLADMSNFEFEALSDPGRFKTALENLCKLSRKTRVPTTNTNSGIFQGAIDAFVETFFDSNSRSNSGIENSVSKQNKESRKPHAPVEKANVEMKNEESAKALKQVKLVPKEKQVEHHRQGASATVKSKINNSNVEKLSTTARTAGDLLPQQFRNGQRKESDECSKPMVTEVTRLPKNIVNQEEEEEEEILSSKEGEDGLEDLDLTQPCVSDVDELLKTYRESMSAISQGTEKLSQLISQHVMKNTLSNLHKTLPSPIIHCNLVENKRIPVESTLKSGFGSSKKNLGQTCSTQKQPAMELTRLKLRYTNHQRDDAKLSNVNNLPTDSRRSSEQIGTFSNEKEESDTEQFKVPDDRNNLTIPTATAETDQQTPANIRPQSLPIKRKTAENHFMGVQYSVTKQSAEVPISIEVVSNKIITPPSKSSLKSPLYTYLNLENHCGKNVRLRRHSNYDIHSDQTTDLNVYDMPLLISGFKDAASDNQDCNDEMRAEDIVPQTKEVELQVFGRIIDAMKNSSQFMKWFVVSLFNGIEIDSVNDVVRNLEDAAVHPIIIEQFLVILRERYRERSSLGGSFMTTSPLPTFDDLQKEKDHDRVADLTKINEDLDNLKKSIDFNTRVGTTNTDINREAENSAALYPIGDHIGANGLELGKLDMNSELMLHKDYAPSIDCSKSQGDRTEENKLQSNSIQSELIPDKNVREEDLTNGEESLAVPKQNIENIPYKSESSLKFPSGNLQIPSSVSKEPSAEKGTKAKRDEQEAEEISMETKICENHDSTFKEQNNEYEKLKNSMLINTTPKKNCSSSSTDKDISFILPCDDEMNEKFVDLSNEEKSTLVTSKNKATEEIIGFQMENSFQNNLRINSSAQEKNMKIHCNLNSEQSSIAIGKSDGKLKIPNDSALTNVNLTENLRKNDENIKCYCRVFEDDKTPKIESLHVPCQSSLDAVNALVNSRIQSKYNQRTSIDLNEKSVRCSPDRMVLFSKGTIDKRSRASKLTGASKSHAQKVADLSKTGNKRQKSLSKNGSKDKKIPENSKLGPTKYVNSTKSSDSEESNDKTGCQLCIKLRGKCSCFDCVNCMTNLRGRIEVPGKKITGREKLVKSTVLPRRFDSPKRLGKNTGKILSPREKRSTSLESTKNGTFFGQGIPKINEKSVYVREGKNSALTKAKMKPKRSMFSGSNSNNNDGPVKNTAKLKRKKILQHAASHLVELKMEDKSENTAKSFTECKNTETENMITSEGATECKELEKIFCEKVTITDETGMQLSSGKFDKAKEIGIGANLSVIQKSINQSTNICCGKTDRMSERITRSSGTENFATIECQTSKIGPDPQKHESDNPLESVPEIKTSTVSKKTFQYPKIDEESIIVLQPLNEIEHTFFIAKPNCVERRLIEEKLNRNAKIKENKIIDQNGAPVHEFNQQIETADRTVMHSNYEIGEHVDSIDKATSKSIVQLNCATSANNFVEKKSCQVGCAGVREVDNPVSNKQSNMVLASMSRTGSDVSFLEEKVECTDFCTNDGECSRMCSQLPRGSDYWDFPCRQDCQNEEVCLVVCAPKPQLEQSVQTNSIDINEVLERFIAENNVPNLKMPIMKAILQELKKFEDILRTGKENLGTIPEKSESQTDQNYIEMENERELVEGQEPRCDAEKTHRKSVQYEEPQENLSHIMQNRKSLILPNVVRGIADMHPSTTLERLKLRSADPLVSGNFNKPESDKRYSVFNQADPASSTIDLNDPRVQEHLSSVTQIAIRHQEERNQLNNPKNNVQQNVTKISEQSPTPHKSNEKNSSKLNKSRRGMDADFSPQGGRNEESIEHNNSMKSFNSCDLEPGEFLEVRTPFDKPLKSYQSSKRYGIMENDELPKEKVQCHGFCDNKKSYSDTKSCGTNVPETTKTQCNTADGSESTNQLSAHNLEPNKNLKAKNSLKLHNNFNSKVAHDVNEHVNENPELEQGLKNSDMQRPNDTINCCNRPQIIDYFLGKTNLDKIKVNYTNNQSGAIPNDCTSRQRDNCHQLYMKLNFTSKTTSELDNDDIIAESEDIYAANNNAVQLFSPRKCDETILANSNRTGSKHWEQTSSDTYSEGEINLPSSCSYSLGEVKVSTASITAGRTFEDPDGLTVFVTKSILDSTLVTGTSPGEILTEINKTESDFSSDSWKNI